MIETDRLDDLYEYGIKLMESLETDIDNMVRDKDSLDMKNRHLISDITAALERYAESGADDAEK